MWSVENVGIAFGGSAFDVVMPGAAFTVLASQLPMYFATSALFFSSIIMWPLPVRPTVSSSTYSVFTPA